VVLHNYTGYNSSFLIKFTPFWVCYKVINICTNHLHTYRTHGKWQHTEHYSVNLNRSTFMIYRINCSSLLHEVASGNARFITFNLRMIYKLYPTTINAMAPEKATALCFRLCCAIKARFYANAVLRVQTKYICKRLF